MRVLTRGADRGREMKNDRRLYLSFAFKIGSRNIGTIARVYVRLFIRASAIPWSIGPTFSFSAVPGGAARNSTRRD